MNSVAAAGSPGETRGLLPDRARNPGCHPGYLDAPTGGPQRCRAARDAAALRKRRLAAALLAALLPAAATAALPPGYRVDAQMRDTGYVLGDLLQQRVDIDLPPGARLQADSLPAAGPVTPWLDLRAQRLERRSGGYRLLLDYQVFGAVESALPLALPAFALRFSDPAQMAPLQLIVPAQPFRLSPVLPAELDGQARQPRSSLAPEPLPERAALLRAGLCLAAAALIGLYLAWLYDRLPFWPRAPGPLTLLWRGLRRRRDAGSDGYQALLRQVHAAFNRCAQETLYSDNLPLLYARAPHLQPLRADIDAFFEHSRAVLYGMQPARDWNEARVLALCRAARDRERGLR